MAWPAWARQDLYFVRPLPPKHCDLRNASPADARAMGDAPQSAPKRCVKLTGILVGRFFFADLDAYTRAGGGFPDMDDVDAGRAGMLGLYGSDEVMRNLPGQPVHVVIAGVVNSCLALRGSNTMAQGYCHYTDGGYVTVGEMHFGEPFKPQRLSSDADRTRIGDLGLLPADDPRAQLARSRVQTWLEIIQGGDLRRLAEFERRIPVQDDPATYKTSENPYASRDWNWLRKAPLAASVQVFRLLREGDNDLLSACICRLDSCDGLWPITHFDAGLNPDRPYACLQVWKLKGDKDWKTNAEFDARPLREPLRRQAPEPIP